MSCVVLAARAAESDSRSCKFNLHGLYARRRFVCRQLPKNCEWTYSRGLLRGLQARFGVEHSNYRNSSGLEPWRCVRPDVAALLSRPPRKQFSVFSATADPRVISTDLHESFHDSGRDLTVGSIVDVFCLYLQFLLTQFANPMMFTFDECVVVDTIAIVFGAEITFHNKRADMRYRNRTKQIRPASDDGSAGLLCRSVYRCWLLSLHALRNFIQRLFIRDLRSHGVQIFTLDCFINFIAVNRNMRRRFDSKTYVIPAYAEHLNFDFVADNQLLILFPRHY